VPHFQCNNLTEQKTNTATVTCTYNEELVPVFSAPASIIHVYPVLLRPRPRGVLLLLLVLYLVFRARCNINILRLCYDASVRLSVRLSVTFVHCGHRILDIFACLDRWMSLLLTDNASPGSSDGMMPGFLVEEGGMETLVIVAISINLLTEHLDPKHVTCCNCLHMNDVVNDVDI